MSRPKRSRGMMPPRRVYAESRNRRSSASGRVDPHGTFVCDVEVRVRVRLFASLREAAGRSELGLELPGTPTAEDAWRRLAESFPVLASRRESLAASVNRRYASFAQALAEGDEVVFIPPVSGG